MRDPIIIKASTVESIPEMTEEFLVVITDGTEVIDHRINPEPAADINKLAPGVHIFDSIEDIKM